MTEINLTAGISIDNFEYWDVSVSAKPDMKLMISTNALLPVQHIYFAKQFVLKNQSENSRIASEELPSVELR